MKVLFLTNIPSPYRVEFFNRLGLKTELCVLFDRKFDKDRNPSWFKKNIFNFKFKFNPSIKEIIKKINEHKNDIIVVTNYSEKIELYAILYMKLKKIPYCIEIDGGIAKKDNFIKKALKTFLLSNASLYLSSSAKSDEYLIHYGAKKNKICRYPFSSLLDSDILSQPITESEKQKIRKKLKINEKNVVISIGRFVPIKGFDLLINAAPKFCENTGIYIIGGQPTNEYLELISKNSIKNVYFIDFLTKNDLKFYFMCADLFILPTREDIWGLVISEAMSYGLPVITTDNCVAGLELIDNEKNGYIIPVNSIDDIYDKGNKILNNRSLKEEMAQNNLRKISSYTIENMVLKHYEIFADFLKKNK